MRGRRGRGVVERPRGRPWSAGTGGRTALPGPGPGCHDVPPALPLEQGPGHGRRVTRAEAGATTGGPPGVGPGLAGVGPRSPGGSRPGPRRRRLRRGGPGGEPGPARACSRIGPAAMRGQRRGRRRRSRRSWSPGPWRRRRCGVRAPLEAPLEAPGRSAVDGRVSRARWPASQAHGQPRGRAPVAPRFRAQRRGRPPRSGRRGGGALTLGVASDLAPSRAAPAAYGRSRYRCQRAAARWRPPTEADVASAASSGRRRARRSCASASRCRRSSAMTGCGSG